MTLVKGLQRQIAQLQGQNAQLAAANERLSKQLAELQRAGKRQAAPFSKGRRTSSPKRPGRKPGQGMFSYRKLPSPDQVTEPIVEVTVPGDTCPGCGGRLEHEGVGVAYVTDIPPAPRPQVTAYRVQVCRCRSCGRPVRGRHPDVAPDQYGASASGWETGDGGGPRAPLLGGRSGQEGSRRAQGADRGGVEPGGDHPGRAATCKRCGGGSLPEAAGFGAHQSFVHTDDTGWRVGASPHS